MQLVEIYFKQINKQNNLEELLGECVPSQKMCIGLPSNNRIDAVA